MVVLDNIKYISEATKVISLDWNSLFVLHSKRYWDSMLRFSYSLVKDTSLSEDLLQSALLKAVVSFSKFIQRYNSNVVCQEEVDSLFLSAEVQNHFRNWLYIIIKNVYLDDVKNRKKWDSLLSDSDMEMLESQNDFEFNNLYSNSKDIETTHLQGNLQQEEIEFYKKALDDVWKKKIDNLNERQRSVLFLASEDYSYKEISSILSMPIGTVMSTLSRTIQKLKSNL